MEKQWFVIRNEKHIGPYDLESLERMFEAKKIDHHTLVWTEGWSEPKSYNDLLMQIDGVPDLPPPIPLDALVEKPTEEVVEHVDYRDESELESEDEQFGGIDEDHEEVSKSKDNKKFKILLFVILFITVMSFGAYLLLKKNAQVSRPSQMKISDFKSLEALVDSNSTKVEFYLSKNRSIIWMGTSNPYTGEVALKLSSVYGRHLGEVEVEAKSYGKLENNIATFNQITFTKGEKIVEGFYNLEAYTTKPLEVPFIHRIGAEREKQISFKGEVYLGLLKIKKFETALALKNKKEQTNEKKFWEELREKYLTIKMITIQIQNAMNDIFKENDKTWKEKVAIFENEYKAKYGDFFTSFVLANEENYKELEKKDFPDKLEVISNYARLSRIAKAIGTSTMDSLNLFESLDKGSELEDHVRTKFQGIIDLCDQKMEMINTTKL